MVPTSLDMVEKGRHGGLGHFADRLLHDEAHNWEGRGLKAPSTHG